MRHANCEKSTEELSHEIKNATNIEDYLRRNRSQFLEQPLPDYLNALLREKNMTRADVVRGSFIDKNYLYDIFSGKKNPSRDKIIAIAFGMRLSADETQRLLKISNNRELYSRIIRDSLILFSLHQNCSLLETNNLLYEHNCSTIT